MRGKMRYRNLTDSDQVIPGVGSVLAGESIDTEVEIENPNFVAEAETQAEFGQPTIAQEVAAVAQPLAPAEPVDNQQEIPTHE
jgi:hypothetical protein